ncbi:MAG: LrgB family protein [Spirochaetales bacterium]|nr:LrgB family protein [Spirochaetales bacterium]
MFEAIFNNPLFGITITIAAYTVSTALYQKTQFPLFSPILTASILIILFLLIFNINLDYYQKGGNFITLFLTPATVALAIPLYRQIHILKKHFLIIIISIIVGSCASIISVIALSKLLKLPDELTLSLLSKSVTTPIAVDITKTLGGQQSITVIAVVLTGITGAIIGPTILRILQINNPTAKGLAMGTGAHAIGTSKAFEFGETEGAISSLSIGLAGIITVILAPLLNQLF